MAPKKKRATSATPAKVKPTLEESGEAENFTQSSDATAQSTQNSIALSFDEPLAAEAYIYSDSDDDDEVVLFPDAEELAEDSGVIMLGTTQDPNDESDSSEDEGVLNRVGDIPLEWYKDEDHIGYDVEGKKLMKGKKSALDQLLEATDDPNAMRTIHDALHDEKKVISNADLQLIFNLQRNRTANSAYDMYGDAGDGLVEFDPLNHPLARGNGPSKKKFIPALHEMKKLAKIVKRILKEKDEKKVPEEEKPDPDAAYMLWDDSTNPEMDTHTKFKYNNRIEKPKAAPPGTYESYRPPAEYLPKAAPPGTYESYRPPAEYLPSEKTKERFARLRAIDKKEHFLPQAFGSLRHVPFYNHTIQDRYQRCLDLAFFPRKQRTRLVVDPSKLLPELPDPKDLRPYPERLSFLYKGHTGTVRSISLDPHGQYLATGCDDHIVRVFEVLTGRIMKRYDVGGVVQQVEFCPNKALNILAVATEYSIVFIVPTFCAHDAVNDHSVRFLRAPGLAARADANAEGPAAGETSAQGSGITQTAIDQDETAYDTTKDLHDEEEREKRADFQDASPKERAAGIVVKVTMHAKVKKFTFHTKGDYMCALCPKDHVKYRQTVMLQLSRRKVFCPFRKFAEIVTDCKFHPREPLFFLSTTNSVRCYNLLAHKLQKRYKAPGGITTCISVHPETKGLLPIPQICRNCHDCKFHPREPLFFLSTTNSVRCYNLLAHRLQKRYKAPGGITTCISVHPDGDNFLVGDTTSHTQWYDCDFSDKPYKRMKSHKGVINTVAYHRCTDAYPGRSKDKEEREN
ncbi:Hypothetical protein, putative [Bodo saltans]|uniref:BOP1 N-terminal domain-containing protein n=1 Tax=Bodo saltans TaxID=75058 RepID=A0A0S4IU17_BODSA|nr:Hypothetical protein, putative [Bodo saltans]|eukprot:CUF92601.1 Hypothetical protein, putative [Bodo saltans]